ncbi:dihydrofolate reductase [Geodermatophilaceae bacterium NBWT11]|nr:dihydrofolate reductase [Geodermatophilaceae bacterium NBWT11]
MGIVTTSASVSVDGFIAHDDDTPGHLFDWYGSGDVEVPNAGDLPPFRLSRASADHWTTWRASLGALVVGRRLFDLTDGWHGVHPLGVPVVVLTHEPPLDWQWAGPSTTFETSLGDAVATAQELAGDAVVGLAAGTVAGQALAAGLLDRVDMDLVPVVLGSGRRYFGDVPLDTVLLGDPTVCLQGDRVTHLSFPVRAAAR